MSTQSLGKHRGEPKRKKSKLARIAARFVREIEDMSIQPKENPKVIVVYRKKNIMEQLEFPVMIREDEDVWAIGKYKKKLLEERGENPSEWATFEVRAGVRNPLRHEE